MIYELIIYQMLSKRYLKLIIQYIIRLNENDNFLIYYAGHGYYDETLDQNYWLPIEADKEDDSEWIDRQS